MMSENQNSDGSVVTLEVPLVPWSEFIESPAAANEKQMRLYREAVERAMREKQHEHLNEHFADVLDRGYVAIEEPLSDLVRERGGRVRVSVQDEQSGASVSIAAAEARRLGEVLIVYAGDRGEPIAQDELQVDVDHLIGLALSDPHPDADCLRCECTMSCHVQELEPTPLCDPCAQEVLRMLAAELQWLRSGGNR